MIIIVVRGNHLSHTTPNLPANIMDFKGFDSSIILILRGGIPRPIGDFPECLSQAMLVGITLVGWLGVVTTPTQHPPSGGASMMNIISCTISTTIIVLTFTSTITITNNYYDYYYYVLVLLCIIVTISIVIII